MAEFVSSAKLTLEGATKILQAALARAKELGVPECITIVDAGGHLLAFARMDGARVLSQQSATRKAMTAATTGQETGRFAPDRALALAEATDGRMTNLLGGLPLLVDGHIVGGIGVGSGTGEQDRDVARAAVALFETFLDEGRPASA